MKTERLKHDLSKSTGDILLDNSCDPDLNFCNIKIEKNKYPLYYT